MKLLAIDGNSMLNRAFYGVKLLSNREGIYTNAIFGFFNIFFKLLKEQNPDGVAVAFDVSRKTFRNDRYDGYKANRHGMPDELRMQLPYVKQILRDAGYAIVECEGFEGDDVLGTLASYCEQSDNTCVVVSGDRDCLQLLSEQVSVCLVRTKENVLYTPALFFEEYGFSADKVPDLKGLMGDSSDNIPGVRGIGEKTAKTLVSSYGTIESLYEQLDEIKLTPSVRKKLTEGKEQAFLSKELATIVKNAPVLCAFEQFVPKTADEAALSDVFKTLELNSFFEKFGIGAAKAAQPAADAPTVKPLEAGELSAVLSGEKWVVLETADGTFAANETVYAPVSSDESFASLFTAFCEKNPTVYTFGAKPLYKKARDCGFLKTPVFVDLELAAYLIDPDAKGYVLFDLMKAYVPGVSAEPAVGETLAACFLLADAMLKEIASRDMTSLLFEIEMPFCEVLADMEREGFAVDKAGVEQFGEQLAVDIERITNEIYELAGAPFNINSTRELGTVLFETLGLPAGKKTKTGYSTSAEVLEELSGYHEIVPLVLEYRKLTKLYSTYVTGLLKVIGEDGRVHSTFNQTETRTGRISSSEPNVQNIPVRTPLGSEMRRFFVARPGFSLVDADYSQIELRILAHIANDPAMIRAFNENADIHTETASQVFGIPKEMLPPELRSRAKAINFGIVYGIGAFSLSKQIGVTVREAKAYIDAYLKTYHGVADYQKRVVEQAKTDGFVQTIYKRRRELPEIHSTNHNLRAFAERVAMNMPVQGTAADLIKIAMIRVHHRIREELPDARIILQVHDELIVEAPTMMADRAAQIVKEEMEHAASLRVTLLADAHTGQSWYEAK